MHTLKIKNEKVKCPFCKKGEIEVTTQFEYYSYHAARAFGKVKQIPVVHPERIKVESACPNCKAKKTEIKEALERGTSQKSDKKFIKRLKKAGIPTKFEVQL